VNGNKHIVLMDL